LEEREVPYCRFVIKAERSRAEHLRRAKAILGIAVEIEETSPQTFLVLSRETDMKTAMRDFDFLKGFFEAFEGHEIVEAKVEGGYRK
jgi:hypothetical protein